MRGAMSRRAFVEASSVAAISAALASTPHVALAGESVLGARPSEEDIRARLRAIDDSYHVGELLSEDDAEFVLAYGTRSQGRQRVLGGGGAILRDTQQALNISGTKYGTAVKATGTIYYRVDGLYKTYGANATITVSKGGAPKSMKLTVSCVTYGILGEGGVVQTYNGSVNASCQNKTLFKCNPQGSFYASAVIYSVTSKLDVTTKDGNFFTLLPS